MELQKVANGIHLCSKVHTLRGMIGEKVQWVGDLKLQKAMPRAAQVCMIQLLEAGQDKDDLFALYAFPNFAVT